MAIDRRQFVKMVGLGGVTFASGMFSGLPFASSALAAGKGKAGQGAEKLQDFFFVQLTDTHWGFQGPKLNPHADVTLKKAVAAVNALTDQPDFIIFTGDLTHTTDDEKVRRKRLSEFKEIVSELKVKNIKYIPGEHDASLDEGAAYKEFFGPTYYSFQHKGVHFICLDNVSDPAGSMGDPQLSWMISELNKIKKDQPVVVFAHRPLFDLAPEWDWATKDGAKAIELLMPFKHVSVLYGHIHQEHHHQTAHISHHAATSLIFPLSAAGSAPKKSQTPWDESHPYQGLGFREIKSGAKEKNLALSEIPIKA
jgi:3',5'-cyclic AMP phosphodiesterase CpdA